MNSDSKKRLRSITYLLTHWGTGLSIGGLYCQHWQVIGMGLVMYVFGQVFNKLLE